MICRPWSSRFCHARRTWVCDFLRLCDLHFFEWAACLLSWVSFWGGGSSCPLSRHFRRRPFPWAFRCKSRCHRKYWGPRCFPRHSDRSREVESWNVWVGFAWRAARCFARLWWPIQRGFASGTASDTFSTPLFSATSCSPTHPFWSFGPLSCLLVGFRALQNQSDNCFWTLHWLNWTSLISANRSQFRRIIAHTLKVGG